MLECSDFWDYNISRKKRSFKPKFSESLTDLSVDKISGQNAITRCFGIYHVIGSISSKMPIILDSKSEGIRSFGIFHNSIESVLWAKFELKRA